MLNKQASETIKTLIQEELELANKKYGPFLNRYDGLGKLYEEYDESREQWGFTQQQLNSLVYNIRQGYNADVIQTSAEILYTHCTLAIEELCQLAAMSRKFQEMERGAKQNDM